MHYQNIENIENKNQHNNIYYNIYASQQRMSQFSQLPKSCQHVIRRHIMTPTSKHSELVQQHLDLIDKKIKPLNPNSPFEPRIDLKQINDPIFSEFLELQRQKKQLYDAKPKFDFQHNPYGKIVQKYKNNPHIVENQNAFLHNDAVSSIQMTRSQGLRNSLQASINNGYSQSVKTIQLKKIKSKYLDQYNFNKDLMKIMELEKK